MDGKLPAHALPRTGRGPRTEEFLDRHFDEPPVGHLDRWTRPAHHACESDSARDPYEFLKPKEKRELLVSSKAPGSEASGKALIPVNP
jgi:hypothetical protein